MDTLTQFISLVHLCVFSFISFSISETYWYCWTVRIFFVLIAGQLNTAVYHYISVLNISFFISLLLYQNVHVYCWLVHILLVLMAGQLDTAGQPTKGLSQNICTYYHVSTYELNELFRISKRTNIRRSSFGVKTEVHLRMNRKRSWNEVYKLLIRCYTNVVEFEFIFVLFYELILIRIVRTSENKKAYEVEN